MSFVRFPTSRRDTFSLFELVVVFVVTIVPADACFYLLWISTAKVAKLKLVKMGLAVPQKK